MTYAFTASRVIFARGRFTASITREALIRDPRTARAIEAALGCSYHDACLVREAALFSLRLRAAQGNPNRE